VTNDARIAHVLRRLGLGAGDFELAQYRPLGVEGTIDRLLNYEKVDEGFAVSPWELCFEPDNAMFYTEVPRMLSWWCLRLLLTKRPFQEKLTLFWHDHFAVSGAKVEFGPMMLGYLETLRRRGSGDFPTLLEAVAKEPAMLFFLDTTASVKGQPNENFARELFELFTLGIGHYTEADIREAARCFTGWGIRYLVFEQGGEKLQEVAKECLANGTPMTPFAFSPDLHDDGEKTVLGLKGRHTGEDVLRIAARHPQTARHLTRKLWEFFAYPDPEPALIDRLARGFAENGLRIKPLIRKFVESDEFWSERCVRRQIKSPVDFTVAIFRQLGAADLIRGLRPANAKPTTPLVKPMRDAAGAVGGLMFQQGMLLLYPPDVGGWNWGPAWISAESMAHRIRSADLIFGIGTNDHPVAAILMSQIGKPRDSAELVDGLLRRFDAEIPVAKRKLLVEACDKAGGAGALAKADTAATLFASVCRLLFAAPEFHLG